MKAIARGKVFCQKMNRPAPQKSISQLKPDTSLYNPHRPKFNTLYSFPEHTESLLHYCRKYLSYRAALNGVLLSNLTECLLGASACVELRLYEEAITWCDEGLTVSFNNIPNTRRYFSLLV